MTDRQADRFIRAEDRATTLGNLICYRGSVLSQSPLVLDKFEQLDVLQKRTEEALADNPNDADRASRAGRAEADGRRNAEAVQLLKRAFELAPDDALTQEMLVELLLEALAADYATFRDDVPLVARLIHDREQQIELLRIEARGLDKLGPTAGGVGRVPAAGRFHGRRTRAACESKPNYSVRSDRWICGRLGALWSDAIAGRAHGDSREAGGAPPRLEQPAHGGRAAPLSGAPR